MATTIPTARRLQRLASQIPEPNVEGGSLGQTATSAKFGNFLEGQVAIITGSGQGIGAATALRFADVGCKVVVNDLDEGKANEIVSQIESAGGCALAFAGDVTKPTFATNIVQAAIERFGRLDILVNNAGYTWDGVVHKMGDKQWEAMLAIHATAPFRLVRAASPYMRESAKQEMARDGVAQPRCIVNVSSTSGTHGKFGQANYSAGKMAVVGFTKTMAKEWGAFNIRCNAVAFGLIDTRLTRAKEAGSSITVDGEQVALGIPQRMRTGDASGIPLRRAGTADDAAGAILFLASPLASYVTGQCLECTGGIGM